MPTYVCRWQNGDFSVVDAISKTEAIIQLDQEANADVADVFLLRNFMVHFTLRKKAEYLDETIPVELESFGEETEEFLTTRLYPVYSKTLFEVNEALPDNEPDHETVSDQEYQKALSKVTSALQTERKRRQGTKKPNWSEDPEIRHCQELTDMPKALAARLKKEARE
jgi:hypothetical protein